jgi:hypothetical protein
MVYRYAADLVLVVHAAFVVFVVIGVLLVLRYPRLAWLHLPAVVWVTLLEFNGWICPLTPLEVALRQRAGEAGYGGDFIEHYALRALYPEGLTPEIQWLLGVAVVAINVVGYGLLWHRRNAHRAIPRARGR